MVHYLAPLSLTSAIITILGTVSILRSGVCVLSCSFRCGVYTTKQKVPAKSQDSKKNIKLFLLKIFHWLLYAKQRVYKLNPVKHL
jgi:hypothetical protein